MRCCLRLMTKQVVKGGCCRQESHRSSSSFGSRMHLRYELCMCLGWGPAASQNIIQCILSSSLISTIYIHILCTDGVLDAAMGCHWELDSKPKKPCCWWQCATTILTISVMLRDVPVDRPRVAISPSSLISPSSMPSPVSELRFSLEHVSPCLSNTSLQDILLAQMHV